MNDITLWQGDCLKLSNGQQQRIIIARMLLKNPDLFIFDESTSALDNENEKIIQETINKINKTCIIIAHRLSTIKNADLILVMNEGNIIEQGSHDELVEQNGFYADLYNSQFQLEAE